MKKTIAALIFIPLSIYSILGLTIIIVFSLFNQSSNTPSEDQLGFFNYLLPYLLSVGFIIWFNLNYWLLKKEVGHWAVLILIIIAGIRALRWQLWYWDWRISRYINHGDFDVREGLSFLLAGFCTVWVMGKSLFGYFLAEKVEN